MIDHPSLQDTTAWGPISGEAAALGAEILGGEVELDEAIGRAALYLLAEPRIDVVAIALTSFSPTDESGWSRLGGRAWVREWSRPTSTSSILPPAGAGAEAALSMPWLSRLAREEIVALVDRELLPDEASQDRSELARVGIRSLVGTSLISGGSRRTRAGFAHMPTKQSAHTAHGPPELEQPGLNCRLTTPTPRHSSPTPNCVRRASGGVDAA